MMALFPTTEWINVAEAGGKDRSRAQLALAELCRSYWYPIYSFIRSRGHSSDQAAELTQEYFLRLLEGRLLRVADRAKGRFRTLLRTDCTFFLADQADRLRSHKRGKGVLPLPLDDAEQRYRMEASKMLDPGVLFDRDWALDLLQRAVDRLARDETAAGRAAVFDRLKGVLTDATRTAPYAAIAVDLGINESAVQAAVIRLRRRYRTVLRAEVAATLAPGDDGRVDEEEIDEEIRGLFAALAR
jgi:DNA-directed RNA polymerase specialized sigma24 family protein